MTRGVRGRVALVVAVGILLFVVAALLPIAQQEGGARSGVGMDSPMSRAEIRDVLAPVAADQDWLDTVHKLAEHLESMPSVVSPTPDIELEEQTADLEWESFPRGRWSVPAGLLATPDTMMAESLYRHMQLNPTDRYIPPDRRRELAHWMAGASEFFSVNIRAIAVATRRDIEWMINSGQLQPLALDPDPKIRDRVQKLLEQEKSGRKTWASRGVPYVEPVLGDNWAPSDKTCYVEGRTIQSFMVVGGKFYGARRDQLAGAGGLWMERDALAAAYVSRIVHWFVDSGTIDSRQANAVVQELVALTMDETAPR